MTFLLTPCQLFWRWNSSRNVQKRSPSVAERRYNRCHRCHLRTHAKTVCGQRSTALDYSPKTWNMKRETLNALFTARTDRLPCTSGYGYRRELLNQNLTIQATESEEPYSRLTVFQRAQGPDGGFVTNVVRFFEK